MKAFCEVCDKEVVPCGAFFDGEPTYVGFYPCPDHPGAKVVAAQHNVQRTGGLDFTMGDCEHCGKAVYAYGELLAACPHCGGLFDLPLT